ncbi:MAG: LacI family transcriptional regulator [Clostridiales bacterium]|nr:LacI family transcriptional regulator [Clostridiales bacterium]
MTKVTIKDVAKVLGVSYATVSRALSGSPEVSAETRKRVLQTCRELGYTTNYVARSMVIKRTEILGLIVSNIDNPFMSELANHIEERARARGYNLMLCNASHDTKQEEQVFQLLAGRQVDGIILFPTTSNSYQSLKPYLSSVPTVFMSENLYDLPVSYIAVDNYRGTHLGTEYLHSLQHRRILYLGRRKGSTTHKHRAQGYIDACREHGMEPDFVDSSYPYSSISAGYQIARNVFAKPLTHTAIFAATDSLAIGVLQAAQEAGIRIPEDISLLGFDDILHAGLPTINLTTIEQPKKTMATMAVDMLLDKIRDSSKGYSHSILTPSLIVRGSCRSLEDV